MQAELIQISDYRLNVGVDEFTAAAAALVSRAETDGLEGVTRYGFYFDEEAGTAGGVIAFRDPATWVEHQEMATSWEEYDRFRDAVSLTNIEFIGNLPPEMAASIEQAGIDSSHLGTLTAGFVR